MSKEKRPKNLNGFIIESAQGRGLPTKDIPAARAAAERGLRRVGIQSLRPDKTK